MRLNALPPLQARIASIIGKTIPRLLWEKAIVTSKLGLVLALQGGIMLRQTSGTVGETGRKMTKETGLSFGLMG